MLYLLFTFVFSLAINDSKRPILFSICDGAEKAGCLGVASNCATAASTLISLCNRTGDVKWLGPCLNSCDFRFICCLSGSLLLTLLTDGVGWNPTNRGNLSVSSSLPLFVGTNSICGTALSSRALGMRLFWLSGRDGGLVWAVEVLSLVFRAGRLGCISVGFGACNDPEASITDEIVLYWLFSSAGWRPQADKRCGFALFSAFGSDG